MAAEIQTWRLLRNEGRTREDVQRHLAELLGHRDAAIRAGVTRCLESYAVDLKHAEEMLDAALGVPEQKVRTAVANAVAKAVEPHFKPSKEVALAIKGMSSPELEVRRKSAGACASYLLDLIDCRSAAPHFAMALGDPDPEVRENAAASLNSAFDVQGNLDVVRVTLPCIRAVQPTASGEIAAYLDQALRDAMSAEHR
ncbi:MAG TPA: hypothetical protein VNN80_35325 [Polyangiaceae bacterium]|nr:hypothetical protein [Polyangiaceae bacterium]